MVLGWGSVGPDMVLDGPDMVLVGPDMVLVGHHMVLVGPYMVPCCTVQRSICSDTHCE